jgi:hypothetical protein
VVDALAACAGMVIVTVLDWAMQRVRAAKAGAT